MSLLLDRPSLRARVHRVSVEHYHQMGVLGMLDENHELLRGYIFKKMPKSPLHVLIVQKLLILLMHMVPDGMHVRQEQPLSIGDSEPEPDLAVVRGQIDDWANRHPATADLILEIAVSTLELDLEKAEIYAEAGVQEYWLVRPEQAEIDVYRGPVDGRYTMMTTSRATDTLSCGSLPSIQVNLGELFVVRA
jgi:Uma2 family endonuclease